MKKESPLGEGPSVLSNYPVESTGLSASVVQSLDWFLQGKISFEAARDQMAQSVAERPETSVAMMKLLAFAHQGEHLNDDDYQFLVAAVDNARVQEQPTQSYYHAGAAESSNVVELSTRAPVLTPQNVEQNGLKDGDVLKNRYVIVERASDGGMGVVYKAVDGRREEAGAEHPWVAIKMLNDANQSLPEARQALELEAARVQQLSHPNIVNVFDFDRDGDQFFMVMEWLEGEPLTELLQRHRSAPLSRTVALRMLRSIARGLAHAHQNGVAHADVKPANIYITRDRQVKVLDFGLARAVNENREETESEVSGFTPAYASCEVLEGALPTPQDDVYALGCIAYRLLTGNHPFGNLRATEAESQELVPTPIQGLPMGVWESIENALAFRREDRIADAAQFLEHLNPRQRRTEKKGSGGKKIGLVLGLGVVLVGALAAGAFLFTRQAEQPEVRSLEAEAQPTAETLNDQARQALDAGRITEPPLDNALYFYTKALEMNPNDAVATTGLELITQSTASSLETAVNNYDLTEAVRALEVLRGLDPENPLIATASDQLHSIAASNLEEAQATEDEAALPVAQDLVVQAALILGDDSPSVVAIREDLGQRFSVEAKIERLTQGLNASLNADLLLNSSENQPSAQSFIDQLRSIDPLEPRVVDGSERYVSALVFQTMIAASAREFDLADRLIAEAKRLAIQTESVNRAEQEVIRAKTQAAQDAQQLADAQRAAQEAAAAAASEAAAREQEELAEVAQASDESAQSLDQTDSQDASGSTQSADPETGEQTLEANEQVAGGDDAVTDGDAIADAESVTDADAIADADAVTDGDVVGDGGSPVVGEQAVDVGAPAALALNAQALESAISPGPANQDSSDQLQVVPLSALEFARYVQPRLVPSSATRRQEDGFIDIEFTVNQDGTTADIQVMDTTTMTTRSITRAVNALERWRFEPIPQPVRSGVRLRYQDD